MTKGKKTLPSTRKGETSLEVRKELAQLYIQKLRKKGVEPSVKSIARQYLLTEEVARGLLAQELPDYEDIISPRH